MCKYVRIWLGTQVSKMLIKVQRSKLFAFEVIIGVVRVEPYRPRAMMSASDKPVICYNLFRTRMNMCISVLILIIFEFLELLQ